MIQNVKNHKLKELVSCIHHPGWQVFMDLFEERQDSLMRLLSSYNEIAPKDDTSESDDIIRGRIRELNWVASESTEAIKELRRRIEEAGGKELEDSEEESLDSSTGSHVGE